MTSAESRFVGTRPVEARLAFDVPALEAWMAAHVDGFRGPLAVEQFRGGQSNPTYKLTAPSGAYVLRRKPPGKLLPSAHAVDREYRVISALAGTGVPVAHAHGLCTDEAVIGTAFYVMDFVAGRIFWDQRLPELARPERWQIFEAMNEAIARLHMLDYEKLGLADFGKPGNYVARQVARWSKQYRASETEAIPAMDRLIDWLPGHIPAGEETSLVHGDYRMDNIIFHPHEPKILAILDWELATLGNPLSDFCYHAMTWRFEPGLFRGLKGSDFATLGIPDEEQYKAMYCRRAGRAGIDHWDFYMVYNMFRIAAILQGIMGRVKDGTAASQHAIETAARARPIADEAWRLAQSIGA